jgi:hypothetical protein
MRETRRRQATGLARAGVRDGGGTERGRLHGGLRRPGYERRPGRGRGGRAGDCHRERTSDRVIEPGGRRAHRDTAAVAASAQDKRDALSGVFRDAGAD